MRLPVKVRAFPVDGSKRAVELFQVLKADDELERVVSHLEETILMDPMLGIYNRRALEQELAKLISLKKRHGMNSSVIFFDIDDFKRINDSCGHAAGDRVLVNLAATVKAMLRQSDFFARYGGEEFVVLLPAAGIEDAKRAAERIRSVVSTIRVPCDNRTIRFTVSAGVVEIRVDDSIESCLERADKLMYRSKQLGKNRVSAS